jgi:hypothetical protein
MEQEKAVEPIGIEILKDKMDEQAWDGYEFLHSIRELCGDEDDVDVFMASWLPNEEEMRSGAKELLGQIFHFVEYASLRSRVFSKMDCSKESPCCGITITEVEYMELADELNRVNDICVSRLTEYAINALCKMYDSEQPDSVRGLTKALVESQWLEVYPL